VKAASALSGLFLACFTLFAYVHCSGKYERPGVWAPPEGYLADGRPDPTTPEARALREKIALALARTWWH
jgi:hypothetical protein